MATPLLEQFKGRLAISEQVYSKTHSGEALDTHKKLATAMCLKNVTNFINEAFDASAGTQRSDLGNFKKFALNLTTCVIPNLISHDLVIVYPMSSLTGYINYIQYSYATAKGSTQKDANGNFPVINDPFQLGAVDTYFTGATVPEAHTATSSEVTAHKFAIAWTPVVEFKEIKIGTVSYEIVAAGSEVADTSVSVENATGTITFAAADTKFVADAVVNVLYVYNNEVVPQEKLPSIKAEMKSIPLTAKARRISVYYSQLAAYQAKQDYGFDLGDQLAEKAVGQLQYEIDTEVTDKLIELAGAAQSALTWSKALPTGVSKAEHYEGFGEMVEIGKQIIYDRTKRFVPNYMLIASDILPILTYMRGWKAANVGQINGPYLAGTLNGLKVFVTPNITSGKFVIGVNGDDMMSSAACYAPYMPVVPTQLLGYADGGMSQGLTRQYFRV